MVMGLGGGVESQCMDRGVLERHLAQKRVLLERLELEPLWHRMKSSLTQQAKSRNVREVKSRRFQLKHVEMDCLS